MRKENTVNQDLDENLICISLEFFATQKIGMTGEKCIRKRGMTNKKGCQLGGMTLFVYCLLSGVTHAECVPTPDCASIGYTATSCDGGFLRCPFDTSKLFCVPCDSSYKYTCTNTGEVGKGNSCNGKYVECGCASGYELNGGNCVVSCTYSQTSLPIGCSSAYSCNKNGTTYYSSTCTTCSNGYVFDSASYECVDQGCYDDFYATVTNWMERSYGIQSMKDHISHCSYTCTGDDGIEYCGGSYSI